MGNLRQIIAGNFLAARQAAKLSREALAERMGCGPLTIRGWEKGYHWPKPEDIERFADALGIDPLSLFSPTRPKPTIEEALVVLTNAVRRDHSPPLSDLAKD